MKYDWIFFDADETLFHFDAFQGMKLMFSVLAWTLANRIIQFIKRLICRYGLITKMAVLRHN